MPSVLVNVDGGRHLVEPIEAVGLCVVVARAVPSTLRQVRLAVAALSAQVRSSS